MLIFLWLIGSIDFLFCLLSSINFKWYLFILSISFLISLFFIAFQYCLPCVLRIKFFALCLFNSWSFLLISKIWLKTFWSIRNPLVTTPKKTKIAIKIPLQSKNISEFVLYKPNKFYPQKKNFQYLTKYGIFPKQQYDKFSRVYKNDNMYYTVT